MAESSGEQRAAAGRWAELLCLALLLTAAAASVPEWLATILLRPWLKHGVSAILYQWTIDVISLGFGLLLALPTPRRSGICLGTLGRHGWQVLLVVAVPIVVTALVYPRLPVRPFAGAAASMWVISPLAQDLVFSGYLYGRFAELAPRPFHPPLPFNGAILTTGLFFALWHLPNLLAIEPGYVCFQLAYVFVGAVWTGMTRIWTGSILYIIMAHMAVNAIAWATR